jgi:hypothetical protein
MYAHKAWVITEKYADHIPLYRQERRLARQGVVITRSTLRDGMGGAAKILEPLFDLMKKLILPCGTIHTDDTSVKVRESARKIKATGRLWIYCFCTYATCWGGYRACRRNAWGSSSLTVGRRRRQGCGGGPCRVAPSSRLNGRGW